MTVECRFTPEVRQNIPDWIRRGLSKEEIAERIGIRVSSLRALCSRYRISLDCPPGTRSLRVMLPDDTYSALQSRAERMAMTRAELAERILEVVVNDNLFDALELR